MCRRRWRCRTGDRKSTRLNSSHTEIYTLSLHDALPISHEPITAICACLLAGAALTVVLTKLYVSAEVALPDWRSEEHTSELQSHRDLHSFPTRRSSDLARAHYGDMRVPPRRRRLDRGPDEALCVGGGGVAGL